MLHIATSTKTALYILPIAVMFVFCACENNMKEVQEITQRVGLVPGEIIQQMDVLYSDSGTVKMHMTSPLMKHYNIKIKEPYEEFPKGIFIEFYNDKGVVKSTLKSDFAIRYDLTKQMEAKINVEALNEKNEKLYCDHLIWDETTRKIKTIGKVKIVTNNDTLYGKGLTANEDFSEWEISKPIGKSAFESKTDTSTSHK